MYEAASHSGLQLFLFPGRRWGRAEARKKRTSGASSVREFSHCCSFRGWGGLLQAHFHVLLYFFNHEFVFAEQPAKTQVEVLVGADLGSFLLVLTREFALCVEGFPNLACQCASLFFKHNQYSLLVKQFTFVLVFFYCLKDNAKIVLSAETEELLS